MTDRDTPDTTTGPATAPSGERSEGWGATDSMAGAHYFRDARSLCGKWTVIGTPRWESNQARGPEPRPRTGTCKACWRKAPEVAP